MSTYAQTQTVSSFVTDLMNEFGLDGDNDNEGTSSDAILKYVDDANRTFIQHRAWAFRKKVKTGFKLPCTLVETGFTSADTSIVLEDTSEWPNTGVIMVDGDIIPYSANNTLTGTLTVSASDIDRDHDASERVWYLHPVPSDFCKIADLWVGDTPYFPDAFRNTKEPLPNRFWEIQLNTSDGNVNSYFIYYFGTSKEKIYMSYGSLSSNLTLNENSTYIEVPAPYRNYIKYSVFSRIYQHLEDDKNASIYENMANKILREAAVFDSKKHQSNRVPLRTPWDNPMNMLYRGSGASHNRQ